MAILKTIFLIFAPVVGLTTMAFRLKNKLPVATRLFGNRIALAYVYFKVILKWAKPIDAMPMEMISLARKTSQQSQALRRQLKATMRRVRDQVNAKKQQTFRQFGEKTHSNQAKDTIDSFLVQDDKKQPSKQQFKDQYNMTGNQLYWQLLKHRQRLIKLKIDKKQARKFYDQQ